MPRAPGLEQIWKGGLFPYYVFSLPHEMDVAVFTLTACGLVH